MLGRDRKRGADGERFAARGFFQSGKEMAIMTTARWSERNPGADPDFGERRRTGPAERPPAMAAPSPAAAIAGRTR
jgi:hypothetical protein